MKIDTFALSGSVVHSAHQASIELSGEQVILNHQSGTYYGLNNTGAFIWELISRGSTVAGLKAAMLAKYPVSPEQAEADLSMLLADLKKEGLIEIQP